MASTMDNAARPGCNKGDDTGTGAGTGAGTRDDMDGREGVKDKVDIITSDKTNKTSILLNY